MRDRVNFARLVDQIFGPGSASFETAVGDTNDVIAALASSDSFESFQSALKARFCRLAVAASVNAGLRRNLLDTVNLLADAKNWDGAYCELVALDYFFADTRTSAMAIDVDVTVPASSTLAQGLGSKNANFDMVLRSFGVPLDTKILADKTGSILRGIFGEAIKNAGIKSLTIVPTYRADQDFEVFQRNRRPLVRELESVLMAGNRPTSASSSVIDGLSYQFAWQAGVFASASLYSPEVHGENHHSLLFKHAKKFSTVGPSGIVFVHFPWSGEKLFDLGEANRCFFKALSGTFFSKYERSPQLASQLNSAFQGQMTADEVTRYLSAVIFLEDKSVTAEGPNDLNISVSYELNKRANYSLVGSSFEEYLVSRGAFDLTRCR